jgi:hypothetical protein
MRQALFAITVVTLVVGLSGCSAHRRGFTGLMPGSCHDAPGNCASCGDTGCGGCAKAGCNTCATDCGPCKRCRSGILAKHCGCRQAGPPMVAAPYPYYTLRGPRDFLVDNPPTIGP